MKAVLCPVCTGSGIVEEGFYQRTSNTWTSCGGIEKCRACSGKGWVEVNESNHINAEKIFNMVKEEEARRGC